MTLTHLSLFSGIGGIDIAAEKAGIKTIGQVEIADFQYEILKYNWPTVPKWRDVRDVTRESVIKRCGELPNIISGGFPCQPHSLAGKRKASTDERDLWGEYARIIREIKPDWVVAENVSGLLSSETGRFFGRVLRDLDEMGYYAGWGSWRASDVGASHHRQRVFIIGCSMANAESIRSRGRDNGNPRWMQRALQVAGSSGKFMADCDDSGSGASQHGNIEDRPATDERQERLALDRISRFGEDQESQVLEKGRVFKSRLGGNDDGVSGRFYFPEPVALMGEEQFAHEPLRVSDMTKDSDERLVCLGNAVVPQQIYPLFREIADIEGVLDG